MLLQIGKRKNALSNRIKLWKFFSSVVINICYVGLSVGHNEFQSEDSILVYLEEILTKMLGL